MAVGVLVAALPSAIRSLPGAPAGFWAMALAAMIVDIPLFGVTGKQDLRVRSTLSVCFTFAILVLYGAGPAIAVQAIAAVVTVIGQRYSARFSMLFVSRLILATAAAELVVILTGLRPITTQGSGLTGTDVLEFTLLAAVWLAVSYGLLAAGRLTTSLHSFGHAWAALRPDLASTAAAVLVVAPFLTTVPGWWPLLIAAPLMVWNQLSREQLRYQQRLGREPISGLLNRQGLIEGVRAVTTRDHPSPGESRPFGIIFVNVESVLEINRALGRELYEKVIGVASRRLVDAYGEDRAALLSSEGVVILVPDLTEPDAIADAEAAVALLEPHVEVDNIPFALDPAGGVALSPMHGRELRTLLMKAELAAHEARASQRRAVLYVREAAEQAERRITLLRELRTVLDDPTRRREITVLYQPQIHIDTGRLVAVEALVRWTHPRWGPIRTDELIEAIEASEVMHMLTKHVLETAAVQVRRWNDQGEPIRVSVNVSAQDLHEPRFLDELADLVQRHGIAPRQLIVELTERMLISDLPRVTSVAHALARQGTGLSLDDFGTGYASLQQLRLLPLTEVKVDSSYIKGMVDNPADRAIVTSVHQLTRALDVDVVAEGVEDQRTADALATLPGTIAQGWHYGRPMTAEDLHDWRRRRHSDNARQRQA
ncbi:GGDEF domain-containing phosphodiesterase [Hamadaea sp. NPDC050747]|uniref:putative bifunctional diguanylate cyclase/phosphodiesterase n=1 Tax=Hamadaea sp. NPDC050747 TaxID=3155789 RepID=UPI0033F372F1